MDTRRVLAGIVVLAVAATAGGLPGAAWAGALDGKSFLVKAGEAGTNADEEDELVFAGGRFRSKACDPYGFGDAAYTVASGSGGSVAFDAETVSEKEGRMKWHGTVSGDSIQGTFTWHRKPKWYRIFGKDTVEYSYAGKVKSP